MLDALADGLHAVPIAKRAARGQPAARPPELFLRIVTPSGLEFGWPADDLSRRTPAHATPALDSPLRHRDRDGRAPSPNAREREHRRGARLYLTLAGLE
jgi:hypothetical protein